MNIHISKRLRFSLVAALLLAGWYLVSCEPFEVPEPPKKDATDKMRKWNDWLDPNRHPPRIDTAKIGG